MARTQTRPLHPAEHLETEDDMAAYLNEALEEGDLSLIMATLGDIARARRTELVALRQTGFGQGEHICGSLRADGSIFCWGRFATVLMVKHASPSGLQLCLHQHARARDSCGVRNNGELICWGDYFGIPFGPRR